jgi:hypothetical protein
MKDLIEDLSIAGRVLPILRLAVVLFSLAFWLFVAWACTAAHAEDWDQQGDTDRVLMITVFGSSPRDPAEHQVFRMWLPYETRHTCEEAADRVDLKLIHMTVQRKLGKKAKVLNVTAECEVAAPNI